MHRAVYFALHQVDSGHVDIYTEAQAAELLDADPEALEVLPYGDAQRMLIVRSAQRDDTPINREASLVVQRLGVPVGVRGNALAFPRGLPWENI